MFRRIFKGHLIVVFTAIFLLTVTLTIFLETFLYKQQTADLRQLAVPIARQYQTESNPNAYLKQVRQLLNRSNITIQVLSSNQKLPADVKKDVKNRRFATGRRPVLNHKVSWVMVPMQHNQVLLLSSPIEGQAKALRQTRFILFITALLALIISLIISWLFARATAKRITRMRQATAHLAEGNYLESIPIPAGKKDELDQLAFDINQMAFSLAKHQQEAERLEQDRIRFLLDLSHELRTPLTSIRGWLEALKKGYVPEQDRSRIYDNLEQELLRLIRLIQELMDLEKIRAGKLELQLETFSVLEMFSLIREQFLPLTEDKRLLLKVDVAPEVDVLADYDRLYQVFINLVKNALQFTEQGQITIGAYAESYQTILWIEDTGVGLAEDEVTHIFDRFYKVDPSRERSIAESGLGLAIVKQLIEAHHGRISVTSKLGVGTRITITLPLVFF